LANFTQKITHFRYIMLIQIFALKHVLYTLLRIVAGDDWRWRSFPIGTNSRKSEIIWALDLSA